MRIYRVMVKQRVRTICVGIIRETPGKGFKFYPADEHLRVSRVFQQTPEATLEQRSLRGYQLEEGQE